MRLLGLDANATYSVTDEHDADLGRFGGARLMALGLPGDTHFGGNRAEIRSRTLYLQVTVD